MEGPRLSHAVPHTDESGIRWLLRLWSARGTVTIKDGRKRIIRDTLRRNWREWQVLIHDHHESYLTWAEFERNQHLIADSANGKSYIGSDSIRRGEALLPGLFRCARCGRRLHIRYTGKGGNTQRYACRGAFGTKAADNCIGFGGMRVDRVVALEVLDRLQPLGIEAVLAARPRACIIAMPTHRERNPARSIRSCPGTAAVRRRRSR
ncbi:hypothetical protein ACVIHH_008280 [Bradyrhizobium sp. USDA 4518]